LEKNKGHFTLRPMYIFLSYLAHFIIEREMFQTQVREKIIAHLVFSKVVLKIMPFMRKCGKIL